MSALPAPLPPRRALVFARVGARSLHRTWASEPKEMRGWDLQLSTFDPDLKDDGGDFPLSVDKGTKWDSVARFFRANPHLLHQYDYVLFPDDDLLFDPGAFERIFELCRENALLIAQPALTPTSYFSHPLLLASSRFRLRYSTTIEPMCPCIETGYLRDILWCFERWNTGWGQDLVWTHLMAEPSRRVAVLDAVAMTHTRPLQTGQIYEHFKRRGIDFEAEMRDIRDTFDDLPTTMTIYGGVLKSGRRISRAPAQILNGLHLLRAASASRFPEALMRAGAVLLARSVTMIGYRPRRIHVRAPLTPEPNLTMADAQ